MTAALLYYYEEAKLTTFSVVAVLQIAMIFALFGLERVTRGEHELAAD